MKKEYWFYIDSFIHISIKKNNALLYNPYTGKILEYKNNPQVLKLLSRLLLPRNLRVVVMTEKELSNSFIGNFVREIKRSFMGDLLDCSFSDGKPVQMPPHVKIQKDTTYLNNIKGRSVGEKVMDYLSEISIYLNDRCSQDCHFCGEAYRQFPCCHCSRLLGRANRRLNIRLVENLFKEIGGCRLGNINILGGDVLSYPDLEQLTELLNFQNIPHSYFAHYRNIVGHEDGMEQVRRLITEQTQFMVPVSFPVEKEKLRAAFEMLRSIKVQFRFLYVIESMDDFHEVERLQSEFPSVSPIVRIFYNGNNRAFFEENVYVDREDIVAKIPHLKTIYMNSTVNRSNFGKLTILPNGRVHANVNNPGLGILGKDSIYDMLTKEMTTGKSWRKIRKHVTPCKSCVFEKLCPPLSDYNTALGRNNLCHIY
jgi:pseudo-rSAM protein